MQAGLEMRPCWEDFSVGDFLDSLTAFEIGDHCQILRSEESEVLNFPRRDDLTVLS